MVSKVPVPNGGRAVAWTVLTGSMLAHAAERAGRPALRRAASRLFAGLNAVRGGLARADALPWRGEAAVRPESAVVLPPQARWALEDVRDPSDLWSAEAAWWLRVERDAWAMRSAFRPGQREDVVAAVALLTVDAWRVAAALELAAQGGRPLEAFDAVA